MSTLLTQQQQAQQDRTSASKNESLVGKPRPVPSGKVYRQLFEAQVQLSEAYDRVKENYRKNPPQLKNDEDSIPLVKEGRGVRGNGLLTNEEEKWLYAQPNEIYVQNPIYEKYKSVEKIEKSHKLKKKFEKEEVNVLPDVVVPASKGSTIETRIENSRKKKHNEVWEDLVHEIGLINMNLEPQIKKVGNKLKDALNENNKEIDKIFKNLNETETITNGSKSKFDEAKNDLLQHTEKRKELIEQMDNAYLKIEDERVENIREILNKYSEVLFKISFLPKPQIEKLLDNEIQQLNNQILINKRCYAQLYAKLITVEMEREKEQVEKIAQRMAEWRAYALNVEMKKLEEFIGTLNMLNPTAEINLEEELQVEQKLVNMNRLSLIESLRSFKPPNASTKSAVYKWYDSFKEQTKQIESINANYVEKLKANYELSNQKIISEIESRVDYLVQNHIIDGEHTRETLQENLLPIWSAKQREIEEHIETVENEFDELSKVTTNEINKLFKFLQGISHVWDLHELGLMKKERSLQELLQDCRKDHDLENQKREEKLDSILDQLREASSEKDLKRFLANVSFQLDAIQRGYVSFRDAQIELVKQYPEMVTEELNKYKELLFKFFAISPTETSAAFLENSEQSTANNQSGNQNNQSENVSSFRNILNEVLKTEKGTKFYVMMRSSESSDSDQDELSNEASEEQVAIEENNLDILSQVDKIHLKNYFVPINHVKDLRSIIRMNFLNHLDVWLEEAQVRSGSIVAAKNDEIDKELDLRLHLHEPRIKRAEMDVHNVRAAELLMHDDRVERHCNGIQEAINQMQKFFDDMQNTLNEMGNQNRLELQNLEVAYTNATKSLKITSLQKELNKQRDGHMENIKTSLRNFRVKFDDTLSELRNSNAKFRLSFSVFSDGGNFSGEEIENHKKKLEKMASLIDASETNMLKEMEKLEKKHLDDAIKLLSVFQEKHKYHIIDLQFIEKISRWVNDAQIKIKINVNESNLQAKKLHNLLNEFEVKLDACEKPNLDKITVTTNELFVCYDDINKCIYERASYLKCYKNEDSVPIEYRAEKISAESIHQGNPASMLNSKNNQTTDAKQKGNVVILNNNNVPLKTPNEDPALTIIKNIFNFKKDNVKVEDDSAVKESEEKISDAKNQMSQKNSTIGKKAKGSKLGGPSGAKTSTSSSQKAKNAKLYSVAEVNKIIEDRRAKTRDEMFSYYCTFGEHKTPGEDFMARITNTLRDSLEGILTNAEIFYRDLQQQNRKITRTQSIKISYPEFAETMIAKLKSYHYQCKIFLNQSLKEFRDCLVRYEMLCSRLPEIIIKELFDQFSHLIESKFIDLNQVNEKKIDQFEKERISNESALKPKLGHPNMVATLENLNKLEQSRQAHNLDACNKYIAELNFIIKKEAENFLKELSKSNEFLLLSFDNILCVDDVKKHEMIPEKHKTNELLKRQMAGVSLEDPEPEPLIKREKGKWNGVEIYDLLRADKKPSVSATISTAKTTLAHQKSAQTTLVYHEKFKKIIENKLIETSDKQTELLNKLQKWSSYWSNSIKEIKKIYN